MADTFSDEPVTLWIRQLQAGQPEAAQPLWDHFCRKLTELARARLPANVRGAYDEDDVAISAFHSLFRAVQDRRLTRLDDRNNLWRVLVVIAERKMSHRVRGERALKRDVQRSVGELTFGSLTGDESAGINALVGHEPTPEFAAEVADTFDQLIQALDDPTLRDIARLRLENSTSTEIAQRLQLTRRTIDRKLLEIRKKWEFLANTGL